MYCLVLIPSLFRLYLLLLCTPLSTHTADLSSRGSLMLKQFSQGFALPSAVARACETVKTEVLLLLIAFPHFPHSSNGERYSGGDETWISVQGFRLREQRAGTRRSGFKKGLKLVTSKRNPPDANTIITRENPKSRSKAALSSDCSVALVPAFAFPQTTVCPPGNTKRKRRPAFAGVPPTCPA